MDIENEKIGNAYNAPDSYFKDTELRLIQRLGISSSNEKVTIASEQKAIDNSVTEAITTKLPLDTTGVQKRARKQDPVTLKSVAVNKEDESGNVSIPSLVITTNENPEWVNFGAIPEESPEYLADSNQEIKVVSYSDLLKNNEQAASDGVLEVLGHNETAANETNAEIEQKDFSTQKTEPEIILHEVPSSVGLDDLESYLTNTNLSDGQSEKLITTLNTTVEGENIKQTEAIIDRSFLVEKPISLEAPATAFAPIAGRQKETATPGWLGVAAAIAAVVAAYFIWTAIQPPELSTEQVALQEEESTYTELPLDEQISADTIPDGLQLVEPLIMEEMPKYKEPNIYTIIDAEEMPERTKVAVQDLEDHGLATFDMEDELFEELDFESL